MNPTFFGLEFDDASHRPEDFLLHDRHLGFTLCEDGWLDKISILAEALSPKMNRSALLLSRVNESHDTLKFEPG
jgi:hypothetical protein